MKKKHILDIVMTIFMLLLINKFFTGILIHEILGIIILLLFVYHIILNKNWISRISSKILNEYAKVNRKTKVIYFLDIIVFASMLLSIISGLLVSQVLFNFSIENKLYLSAWHHFFSYWLAIILIVHIGFHWNIVRTKLKIKKGSLKEVVFIFIILFVILYFFITNDVFKKIIPPKKEDYVIVEDKNKFDDSDNNAINNDDTQKNDIEKDKDDNTGDGKPSLSEYLSKFTCNGCGRHCILTNPRCGRGMQQQEIKVNEYNEKYNVNESYR